MEIVFAVVIAIAALLHSVISQEQTKWQLEQNREEMRQCMYDQALSMVQCLKAQRQCADIKEGLDLYKDPRESNSPE